MRVVANQAAAFAEPQPAIWRDPDVLDTWFSSALWPFATLGWPDAVVQAPSPAGEGVGGGEPPQDAAPAESPLSPTLPPEGERENLFEKHYPNSLLISGFDILFFWDARMMMMGRHLTGENPWKRLYLHGLVRAPDGAKMSKSKGNVVDPLGLIDKYGADALRFFMAAMESQGRDIKMDEARLEGYRNFATKLWNAVRFCQANGIGASTTLAAPPAELAVNRWIIGEVVETLAALEQALDSLRFDAAANAIYHFVWDRFCDWYLELIKPVLSTVTPAKAGVHPSGSADGAMDSGLRRNDEMEETRAVAGWALDQILVMLHPFMPFVTEELWHALASPERPRPYELMVAKWPKPQAPVDEEARAEIDWLIALTTATRSARNELGIAPGMKLAAWCPAPSPLARRLAQRSGPAIERLARLAPLRLEEAPPGAVMQVGAGEDLFVVPLEGVIDIAAEKARLAKAQTSAEKERDTLVKRLANPAFVEKAKPEAVEKARADHAHHAAEVERLTAALARLG